MREICAALLVAASTAVSIGTLGAQTGNLTLTAVPGIKVGHHTLTERPTGCTAILVEAGAVAGVDVRGAAPASAEDCAGVVKTELKTLCGDLTLKNFVLKPDLSALPDVPAVASVPS